VRLRPWPIVILAILHLLGPIGNVFLSAALQDVHPWLYLVTLLQTASWWGLIDFFVLIPVAGMAIYACKKWSYPVFLAVAADTVYSNFLTWHQAPEAFPLALLIVTVFLDIAFVAYFLFPAVWATYSDPRLRWWESKPRYFVRLLCRVRDREGEKHCVVTDIAEGGIFVKTSKTLLNDLPVQLSVSFFGEGFTASGRVVYFRPSPVPGYGIQFIHTRESARAIRRLTRALKLAGVKTRGTVSWREDLIGWMGKVLRTGKGLVPEIPNRVHENMIKVEFAPRPPGPEEGGGPIEQDQKTA